MALNCQFTRCLLALPYLLTGDRSLLVNILLTTGRGMKKPRPCLVLYINERHRMRQLPILIALAVILYYLISIAFAPVKSPESANTVYSETSEN